MLYMDARIRQKGKVHSVQEGMRSAQTLQKIMNPRYPMLLLCNAKIVDALGGVERARLYWDDVRLLNESAAMYAVNAPERDEISALLTPMGRDGAMLLKLYAYMQSPFDRTVFLDSDVFVLAPSLIDSLLMHTLQFADLAAPVDPFHTDTPSEHAPMICMGLAAFRMNAVTRQLWLGAISRMAGRHAGRISSGFGRNSDQEAIYEEWVSGKYDSLRVVPLTEEYYCPQVPLASIPRRTAWSTSWTLMKKRAPYTCKAVHGHGYTSHFPTI